LVVGDLLDHPGHRHMAHRAYDAGALAGAESFPGASCRSTLQYGVRMLLGRDVGVGGPTFGLSIRYLGIALGYAIALGFCTAFGTLTPPIFSGQMYSILHEASGQVILAGVGVCMVAIAVSGLAGNSLRFNRKTAPESFVPGRGAPGFPLTNWFSPALQGSPVKGLRRRVEEYPGLRLIALTHLGCFSSNLPQNRHSENL
jgi:hypothetical protein